MVLPFCLGFRANRRGQCNKRFEKIEKCVLFLQQSWKVNKCNKKNYIKVVVENIQLFCNSRLISFKKYKKSVKLIIDKVSSQSQQ